MSRLIKDIKDKNTGLLVYPRTHLSAVVVDETTNLENLIGTNVGSRLNLLETTIKTDGSGEKYLSDNGTYQTLDLSGKLDIISDLETIRSGAALGTTSVQPNSLSTVATSGSYGDLSDKPSIPSALSALSDDANHRTVTDAEKSIWNAKSDFSGSYNDLADKPTIPSAVTESTVSGWGFTKNTGTITGITMNGTSKGTSGVVNLGTVITAHQDISGKQDKLVSGTNIKTVNNTSLLGSGNISISTPTIDTFQTRTGTTHSISSFAANTVFSCSSSGNTTSITISKFADPTPTTRAAYYTIVFKATSCTFTVPSTVMWVGGNAIEFDSSTAYTYEVNFMKIQLSEGVRYLATWNRY